MNKVNVADLVFLMYLKVYNKDYHFIIAHFYHFAVPLGKRRYNMSRFPLVVILLSFLLRRGDCQCSCSELAFIKQLLQKEIFERKLEMSKLQSEIQTTSNGPVLIETDSVKGGDINTRVEILERRFVELENASSTERKTAKDENEANLIRMQKKKDFQSIVKNTLKNEKIERVNFIANIQNEIERAKNNISVYMKATDAYIEEQVNKWSTDYDLFEKNSSLAFSDFRISVKDLFKDHVTETYASMNLLNDSMAKYERNVSQNFEDFTTNITNAMNDKIQKIIVVMTEFDGDVKNLKRNVDAAVSFISSLEANVTNLTEVVENSKKAVSELQVQVKKQFGTCDIYGPQWRLHDTQCYLFIDDAKSWLDANRTCERLRGGLLKIDSKEENNFITNSITTPFTDAYWIGLNDIGAENAWQWSSSKGFLGSGHFNNWAPNEPNDAFGNEDCATILKLKGLWNDYTCSQELPFICEADSKLL